MLKQLRKRKTAKKILWSLAIIIIPAFVLWGSGSLIRGKGKPNFAGRVFGKKISFLDYEDAFLAVRNQAILQYGEDLKKIEKYLGLHQKTWDRLILLYEADRIKIKNREVVTTIGQMPIFQEDGKFNQKIYDYVLRYIFKISARTFEEGLRDSLKISKLYEQITADVSVDEQELEGEYRKENEQVKVAYIAILPEEYKENINIKDEEIKDYFQDNKGHFLRPVSVNIEYLGLDYPLKLDGDVKQEIRNKVLNLKDEIINPADFEKISEDKDFALKETGFFAPEEPIPQIGWSKEFSEAAFNLTKEDVSPPIDTLKGIYILRLKKKRESYIPEIDEVKDKIIDILTKEKTHLIAKEKADKILLKLKEKYRNHPKANFSDLCKRLGLEVKETPLFKQDTYIEEIGISKGFSDSAFGSKEKEISEVIETKKAFYILKVIKFVEIDRGKFEEEHDQFRDKLLTRKKEETFIIFLQELRSKANLTNYIDQDYRLSYR